MIAWTDPVPGSSDEVLAAYSAQTWSAAAGALPRGLGTAISWSRATCCQPTRQGVICSMNVQTVESSHVVFGRLDNGRFTTLPWSGQAAGVAPCGLVNGTPAGLT